jgi:phosphopantetheine--protein transferase-like protein
MPANQRTRLTRACRVTVVYLHYSEKEPKPSDCLIDDDCVEVRYACTDEEDLGCSLRHARAVLTARDFDRFDVLRSRANRCDFLGSKLLLYTSTLAYRRCRPAVNFSLSRTRGLAAVAVARRAVGVDVERVQACGAPLVVAREFFSESEKHQLISAASTIRCDLFCRLWTLKEAYAKCCGAGLSEQLLRNASFELDPDGVVFTRLDQAAEGDAKGWQFATATPAAGYVLSIAARDPHRRMRATLRKVSLAPARQSAGDLRAVTGASNLELRLKYDRIERYGKGGSHDQKCCYG